VNIQQLSNRIRARSEAFAEVMSASYSLFNNHLIAEEAKEYLGTRLFNSTNGFSFGYFPNNEHINLLTQYIDEQMLCDLGLMYKKFVNDGGISYLTNFCTLSDHNLIMPYCNLNGDIIALVGRSLLPDEVREHKNIPKYKNTKFHKSLNLFGLNKAKKHILEKECAIIVEGQFDCITCHNAGFKNVVALGGISLTKFQLYLLLRYTKTIYLLLDNDAAGKKATDAIIKRYSTVTTVRSFDWNGRCEKDADELVRSGYDLTFLCE